MTALRVDGDNLKAALKMIGKQLASGKSGRNKTDNSSPPWKPARPVPPYTNKTQRKFNRSMIGEKAKYALACDWW